MTEFGKVTAIVLAAGEGSRMKSSQPKVLHVAAGRPLLVNVLAAMASLPLEERVVVASPGSLEIIEERVAASGFEVDRFLVQDPPRGTADAVRVGLDALPEGVTQVLVTPGDTPLLETDTLRALIYVHRDREAAVTLLTARISDPTGYGRVVRNRYDGIERIVEDRDANYDERTIDEINAGVYVFDVAALRAVLDKVESQNAQGEYYITDAIGLLRQEGRTLVAYRTHPQEVLGVNSRAQLARVSEMLRRRAAERWMDEGVTIVDPNTTYIDASVSIGPDAVIHPFTFLEGASQIGDEAVVGPNARVVDSAIGAGATVSFSVVIGSEVGPEAAVGPFASLRPGTKLERGARAGTFVETKKTIIGEGSKANHLAYLGDAEIGRGVNVGAGTITCNWDGVDKHKTVIDDDAYIGSDTMLVAPAHIGKRAATGAGSVVRGDVPDDALAVGVPARVIEGRGNKMARSADTPEDPDEMGG